MIHYNIKFFIVIVVDFVHVRFVEKRSNSVRAGFVKFLVLALVSLRDSSGSFQVYGTDFSPTNDAWLRLTRSSSLIGGDTCSSMLISARC